MLPLSLSASVPNDLTVCILGVGIVFAGLIVIILLCKILGAVCKISENLTEKKSKSQAEPILSSTPLPQNSAPTQIANRGEVVAAISAAIAEDLGKDVSAIRIVSIEKM